MPLGAMIERWQHNRRVARSLADIHRLVAVGERSRGTPKANESVLKALALLAGVREGGNAPGGNLVAEMDLLEARAYLVANRAADALPAAHRAAAARPYDVDSRVTHGLACLALDRLEEAEHEFESVLEEFGGDPDAETGQRAVSLARGRTPLDEHSLPEDVDDAAALLVRSWRTAGTVPARLDALRSGGAEGAVVDAIDRALDARERG